MISPVSCSLPNWALNDSAYPFCRGDPGSIKAVSTLAVCHRGDQRRSGEFRPVIRADIRGHHTGFGNDVLEYGDHMSGGESPPENDDQGFFRSRRTAGPEPTFPISRNYKSTQNIKIPRIRIPGYWVQ